MSWELESPEDGYIAFRREEEVVEAVAARSQRPTLRFWKSADLIVMGRSEPAKIKRRGISPPPSRFGKYPCVVRGSGGGAVMHTAGDLNISVILPVRQRLQNPRNMYQILNEGIRIGLAERFGLNVTTGACPNAFCDGDFNVLWQDRKLVGTSQLQRRGVHVVHGTIMVKGRAYERVATINAFYRSLFPDHQPYDVHSATTLEEALGREVAMSEVVQSLLDGYKTYLGPMELRTREGGSYGKGRDDAEDGFNNGRRNGRSLGQATR